MASKVIISFSPRSEVEFNGEKFRVTRRVQPESQGKEKCDPKKIIIIKKGGGDDPTYLYCPDCNGKKHENFEEAPVEVRQPLHPKHPLQLVVYLKSKRGYRSCYCCDEPLNVLFYYCSLCDCAISLGCVKKQARSRMDGHVKRHVHPLYLFRRRAFLTCNVCGLDDPTSPIYMCPPCNFVVHLKCIAMPYVIKISRHPHRISFTPSFNQGDLTCGICQRKINKTWGGYFCIKDGCSYAAHTRCATQSKVWDGKELEGEPEEIEEEVEPFLKISDGIIQHFTHEHHNLRLDVDVGRDYDEDKLCQACVTPIYFGNFYSCMECEFILHEKCANLSRRIYSWIHPHRLTLVAGNDGVMSRKKICSACPWLCSGFYYQCHEEGCDHFKLHVQCATISEPFFHESHMHPKLFLTSKPGEERTCWICKTDWMETFNCIECDYSLCFKCATLPQKVRYKHDKHMLTLSYGNETSSLKSWCEVCEKKVNPKEWIYSCDEYCCVTLHTECLFGGDCYLKPGLSLLGFEEMVDFLRNNHHMNRAICKVCNKRCHEKTVYQRFGFIFCSIGCLQNHVLSNKVTDVMT